MFRKRYYQQAGAAQDVEAANTVYIASLLREKTTIHFGCARYVKGVAYFDGVAQPNSVVTEVMSGTTEVRLQSTLTLDIGGKYDKFVALVGRDDSLALQGPGYCVFEVMTDGRRAFRSDAIRPAKVIVNTDGGSIALRKTPQPVEIPVREVKTLRLITRYATEFSQQAPKVYYAVGCVWGGARLLSNQAVDIGQQVGTGPVKDALRRAVVALLEGAPPANGDDPLKVAVPPIRIESGDKSPVKPGDTEMVLRNELVTQLTLLRRVGRTPLVALTGRDAETLASALPADAPARSNPAAVAAIARGFKADLIVLATLLPVGVEWRVMLRLIDATKGSVLKDAMAPVIGR